MPIQPPIAADIRESEPALLSLLDDLKAFERTQKLDNRFNLFTAIDMINREIKHTKFLAFLLDPSGSHGFGDRFLRAILAAIATEHPSAPLSCLDAAILDLGTVAVHTERDHFDISIEFPRLNVLLVIENKVDAIESARQLARYSERARARYSHLAFAGVLLTPDGRTSDEQWGSLSYNTIATELRLLSGEGLSNDVGVVIRHYIEMIERRIVASQELVDACKAIYQKHRTAIDLIVEHGLESPLANAVDLFVNGVQPDLKPSTVRTRTAFFVFEEWLAIENHPRADRAFWSSTFPVQLWFEVQEKKVLLRLEVGPFKDSAEKRVAVIAKLRELLDSPKARKTSTKGGSPRYTRIWNMSEALPEDPSVEEMTECLTRLWNKAPVARLKEAVRTAITSV